MKLLMTFIVSFISFQSIGQSTYDDILKSLIINGDLSGVEQRIIKRDMRLHSQLLEAVLEIEIKDGALVSVDSATSQIKSTLQFAAKSKTYKVTDLVKEEIAEIIDTTINPSKLKQQIIRLQDFVRNDLSSKMKFTSATLRKYGIQIGLYYLLAVQIDYTIPAILMAMGQYKIGATMFAIPFSSTTTAIFASIKGNLRYLRLLGTIGIKDSFAHRNIFKEVRKKFNRARLIDEYLVDIRFRNMRAIISVEQSNIMTKIYKRIGINNGVNWGNLETALKDKGYQHQINRLNRSELDVDTKVLRIFQTIESKHDMEAMEILKKKFGAKIHFLDSLPNLIQHKKWFMGIASSKDMDHVFRYLKVMPKDIEPRIFDKAWRNFILPNLAESFGEYKSTAHYKAFRNLFNKYDRELYPSVLTTSEHMITGEFRNKFVDYIYESFAPLNSCSQVFKMKKRSSRSSPFLY